VSVTLDEVKRLGPAGSSKEQVCALEALHHQHMLAGSSVQAVWPCGVPWRAPQHLTACPLQAYITFSVDADLRSVFSWNTKQLFVFLQVQRAGKGGGSLALSATTLVRQRLAVCESGVTHALQMG
jgi:hypothetical protein